MIIKLKMEEVMEALRKECVIIMGIYGMGGVGKTSLVEKIKQRVKQERLFDGVIKATATQKPKNSG